MPDQTTIAAIAEALEDEYRARAIYQKVIEAFGPVRPFVNIVKAEDRHASLLDARRAAMQAEIDNEEMYERLLSRPIDPSAVAVLRNLRGASQERRLPAFRRRGAR